jgi:hypothetical protein
MDQMAGYIGEMLMRPYLSETTIMIILLTIL